MHEEHETQRHTYQFCRVGFALLCVALVPACMTTVLGLAQLFFPWSFGWLRHARVWHLIEHWSDMPIAWIGLVGTYMLWGRWTEVGWQRRAGLLLLMNLCDVVLVLLSHSNELGLRMSDIGHDWLRTNLGAALGWAEFALMASLACDLLAHLGVEHAAEAGKATRSLAATGAVVWLLSFCERTSWAHWPLQDKRILSLESLLLFLGWELIWTITLIQVTALCFATTRQTSRVLEEMAREETEHDLLISRSESEYALIAAPPEKPGDKNWDGDFA